MRLQNYIQTLGTFDFHVTGTRKKKKNILKVQRINYEKYESKKYMVDFYYVWEQKVFFSDPIQKNYTIKF